MSSDQPLDDLLVDEEQLNQEMLRDLLSDFIRIGKQSGSLRPNPEFRDLNSKQKVTVVLLAQHARFELGMADTEWLSPSEISELSGINKNTVYPTVRDLDANGIIEGDDGEYRIPAHSIDRAETLLQEGV